LICNSRYERAWSASRSSIFAGCRSPTKPDETNQRERESKELTIVNNDIRHPQPFLDLIKDALHGARVAEVGGQDEVGVLGDLVADSAGDGGDAVAFALEEGDGCRADVCAGAEEEEGVVVDGHGCGLIDW
jgi:hypothetical protein